VREAEFWAQIRRGMPTGWFVRRIEDASGNLGTYDTFLAHRGWGQAWMELKVAGPNAKPDLRKGQPAFGQGLDAAGVPCAYLVGSPNGRVRMIGPHTTGDDWREHLIAEWPALDVPAVLTALFRARNVVQLRKAG
jgi:hypothetical protein